MLKLVELKGRSLPFCHGCAAQLLRLSDIPETVEELRQALRRDRRDGDRRGDEKVDQRIFPRERRVGERRGTPRAKRRNDTDPVMALPEFDDLVIEIDDGDIEEIEQTQVKQRPTR